MTIINAYMRNYFNRLQRNAGFTLIELLVVIGILGILATALIATIDPFEQLKKAQDSNVKNAAVEYLDANVRYYTTHNAFPWDTVANGGANCNGGVLPNGSVPLTDPTLATCVTPLTTENELKAGFATATKVLKEVYPTYTAATKTITVCFKPQSKSQQADDNTKFDSNGLANGTKVCTSPALTNGCFWCTQ